MQSDSGFLPSTLQSASSQNRRSPSPNPSINAGYTVPLVASPVPGYAAANSLQLSTLDEPVSATLVCIHSYIRFDSYGVA